jgi:hypothetical protein
VFQKCEPSIRRNAPERINDGYFNSLLEWHPLSVNKPVSVVTINVPKMSERLRERTAELAADPSRIIDRTYPF